MNCPQAKWSLLFLLRSRRTGAGTRPVRYSDNDDDENSDGDVAEDEAEDDDDFGDEEETPIRRPPPRKRPSAKASKGQTKRRPPTTRSARGRRDMVPYGYAGPTLTERLLAKVRIQFSFTHMLPLHPSVPLMCFILLNN